MVDEQLLKYLENFISEERKARFLKVLENRTKFITVAIEDVSKMHNSSAIIRNCEIFGIQEAHVIESQYGETLDSKITMGAEKWVDVYRHRNTIDCMHYLREKGYTIIATTPHEESSLLTDFELTSKTALFFGTENTGLSKQVMEKADGFLKIPMVGFTESFNISVSVALILQNLTDKLKKTDFDWSLTKEEKLEKRLDWTHKSIKSIDAILTRYAEGESFF